MFRTFNAAGIWLTEQRPARVITKDLIAQAKELGLSSW